MKEQKYEQQLSYQINIRKFRSNSTYLWSSDTELNKLSSIKNRRGHIKYWCQRRDGLFTQRCFNLGL